MKRVFDLLAGRRFVRTSTIRQVFRLAAIAFVGLNPAFVEVFAVGDESLANKSSAAPHVVFVIAERGYRTAETLPLFAEKELVPLGFRCSFVTADLKDPNHFPGLELVEQADVVFLSVRRRTLTNTQLGIIRTHLHAGKPLIGIRTSSHAFALSKGEPPAGYVSWQNFDREVLGGHYEGDLGNKGGTNVTTQLRAEQHPIMTGIRRKSFHSQATMYHSSGLGSGTSVILRGITRIDGQPVEMPIAWTNQYGRSRVFYSSLGHATDFDQPTFTGMLVNAVRWCLDLPMVGQTVAGSGRTADMSPAARNKYKAGLADSKEVEKVIREFAGRGEVGDDSEPTTAAESLELFHVHEDFEIDLIASEPTIAQPLFMSWDHRGRMWVVQYRQYPFPAGLKVVRYDQYLRAVFDKVPPPPPNHFVGKDIITVLEDTNGDGRYDKSKDVITGLNIATSVVVGRGGIWVLNPPYLLFYPDADGDDIPDGDPQVHLSGFGLEDTHSVANSLSWGPDGWLYGANGSTTTATINSEATRNVHFKGQCIWRYHPVTKVFEVYAEGGGNTFSLEHDSKGRVFSGTNNGSTRGMHYAQGGYAKKNWGKHGPLTNPYAFGYYQHMRHDGDNDRFAQTFVIYEGGRFPERYDRMVIAANALHNRVWGSRLSTDTSSFKTVDVPPLVVSSDRWFRPVDVKVGPDGGVYLADWYDSRLTHVDPRDNWHKSSGRIYRLRGKDANPMAPFDLTDLSNDELIEQFSHPNKWFRHKAVQVLGERADSSIHSTLRKIATSSDDPRSLEALWALNLSGGFDDDLANQLLDHPDAHVRRWTVRLLGDSRGVTPHVGSKLARLAETESDPEVRSQLASSAKRLSATHGLAIVRQLLARDEDLDDLHIPLLNWWAVESKTESDRDDVLDLFRNPAFWRLPMVRDTILKRVMQRYAMAGGDENFITCAKLLKLAPGTDETGLLMSGLQDAFLGRQIPNVPAELAVALSDYQKSLGESDLALALRLGDQQAVDRAIRFVSDTKSDHAQRLQYIEILGQIKQPQVVKPLLNLLARPADYSVKRVGMLALANYDDPLIGQAICRRYHSTLPDELGVRSTAQRILATRQPWALNLLTEIEEYRIKSQSIPLDVVQQMSLHDNAEIKQLIEKHWGRIRSTTSAEKKQQIERLATLLKQNSGDPMRGQQLFKKNCGVCHTLFGEGGRTGPKLTGYERTNLNFLLPAIVDPSAAIREEFTNFLVLTSDGRTVTGLIDKQDARTVTIRLVNNETALINRDDIEELKALDVSIMPEGLMKKLSDQETRDLLAYVISNAPK
ncbi:MAG: c-type cytochrome [Fuerstiella sp.]|nr:c-type cytochrome [Fuerstiella sp.]MCP4859121.1 c-type cytochrome [Fuerstiella sp.]